AARNQRFRCKGGGRCGDIDQPRKSVFFVKVVNGLRNTVRIQNENIPAIELNVSDREFLIWEHPERKSCRGDLLDIPAAAQQCGRMSRVAYRKGSVFRCASADQSGILPGQCAVTEQPACPFCKLIDAES